MLFVLLLQTLTIVTLILQKRRRQRLEAELALERLELAYLSRSSQLGELSGALAHELNQPNAGGGQGQAKQQNRDHSGMPPIGGAKAVIAIAQIGPMPGTFWSRRTISLCFASAAIRRSICSISSCN
ncbi:hypothetical protein ASE37_13215 [Rhizobium sp. Root268]|nr:hypothetical protein ASC86_13220 [Rhizobium sp. Root1212]KRD24968.1 hypothetical protein ASE37_13215 [Rhizobium sp. Root268]